MKDIKWSFKFISSWHNDEFECSDWFKCETRLCRQGGQSSISLFRATLYCCLSGTHPTTCMDSKAPYFMKKDC